HFWRRVRRHGATFKLSTTGGQRRPAPACVAVAKEAVAQGAFVLVDRVYVLAVITAARAAVNPAAHGHTSYVCLRISARSTGFLAKPASTRCWASSRDTSSARSLRYSIPLNAAPTSMMMVTRPISSATDLTGGQSGCAFGTYVSPAHTRPL